MSESATFRAEIDRNGVLVVAAHASPLIVDAPAARSLAEILETARRRTDVHGVVITSASSSSEFARGEPPEAILRVAGRTAAYIREVSGEVGRALRSIETCGKPVVAAIAGSALGAGFELCLAVHHRIMTASTSAKLEFPDVKWGLTAVAGGTQRLPRLIGVAAALPILLGETSVDAKRALELGIIDAISDCTELVALAKQWVLSKPAAAARWDVKGFRVPGGVGCLAPHAMQSFQIGTSLQVRATNRNDHAPLAILAAVFEGTQVPIDLGLRIEANYFARTVAGHVPHNRIRTGIVHRRAAEATTRVPVQSAPVQRLGVVGAGLMGSGIAHVAASRGLDVVLLDANANAARRAHAELGAKMEPGVFARIKVIDDSAALRECDLVIEAVFEDREVKLDVLRNIEAAVSERALIATNTSTLTIGSLNGGLHRPDRFLGLHFFSPVERMPLLEVIVTRDTSREALQRALHVAGAMGKTPIVVHDSPGFYTSRVFGTYVDEGMAMLAEGVAPALIENAARLAGFPIGPLAVCDEVGIALQLAVHQQAVKDNLPMRFQRQLTIGVVRRMVTELKRTGRRGGGGFYDYPAKGRKRLWPGLQDLYPRRGAQPDLETLKLRLLHIQAVETARCLQECVIDEPGNADVASVLGIGFPPWTGGCASWIETRGCGRFVAECVSFSAEFGPRFEPNELLVYRARS